MEVTWLITTEKKGHGNEGNRGIQQNADDGFIKCSGPTHFKNDKRAMGGRAMNACRYIRGCLAPLAYRSSEETRGRLINNGVEEGTSKKKKKKKELG